MKPSQYYENLFPLEKLLPDLEERAVEVIVMECNYVFECDRIVKANDFPETMKVNQADAVVFYKMGYEAAQDEIKRKLKPIEK